ncbi:2-hydroxyacid dehydrogenase [Gayadomonas joobiniege]|uniref:2-hydroxyacid dehydrogenase n=1 Tax=Gayadomonas joobiniege TaxID=1234606 RepID=UPI0003709BC4|nr:2-hydroxyacid dehydrogenase [Gayadomonas joobiniege]
MKQVNLAIFSNKPYDKLYFNQALKNGSNISIDYFSEPLSVRTATMAKGFDAVCIFVNDKADHACLSVLKQLGVNIVLLRCAGYNQIDLAAAKTLGIQVARVPEYSPEAVAEHCLAMILCLNRKLHKAYNRIKEDNFSLQGLLGFNISGKTIGVVGGGKIGLAFVKLLTGFNCKVLLTDPEQNPQALAYGASYVDFYTLIKHSDIISLHCPLNNQTKHMFNQKNIMQLKKGVMLVNTSRGGLIETQAIIQALKKGHIGYFAMDVYEQESELFFEDRSEQIIQDDCFQRLLTFPNVLITGHQGFFTHEALTQIAKISLNNLIQLSQQKPCANQL